MLRLVLISDTHGKHKYWDNELPAGDIILHAGDITPLGRVDDVIEFLEWFSRLPYKHKVFIAGNHDFLFQRSNEGEVEEMINSRFPSITYLNDTETEVEGYKIWGSPWTPWFNNWAFNLDVYQQAKHWNKIPDDVEILITHGPPRDILDEIERPYPGEDWNKGCKFLRERIKDLSHLKLHVFGHIHEARGKIEKEGVTYVNASMLTLQYKPYSGIYVVELPNKNEEQ